jgi:Spy/CpxP family protein refolding chaperone
MRRTLISMSFVAAAVLATAAWADSAGAGPGCAGGHGGAMMGGGMMGGGMMDRGPGHGYGAYGGPFALDLTDEQRDKLLTLQEEQQKKANVLRREAIKLRFDNRKQVEAILTPEQKKQLRGQGPWWMQGED